MINVRSDFKEIQKDLRQYTPSQIKRASVRGINKAANRVRINSGNKIAEAVQVQRGGKSVVTKQITQSNANKNRLMSSVTFLETGIGVEHTRKASTRKVRGKGGRHTVKFRGKKINAFSLGVGGKRYIRSKNRVKRLFSYTLLQEARRANVFQEAEATALNEAKKEFMRQLKIFK